MNLKKRIALCLLLTFGSCLLAAGLCLHKTLDLAYDSCPSEGCVTIFSTRLYCEPYQTGSIVYSCKYSVDMHYLYIGTGFCVMGNCRPLGDDTVLIVPWSTSSSTYNSLDECLNANKLL